MQISLFTYKILAGHVKVNADKKRPEESDRSKIHLY